MKIFFITFADKSINKAKNRIVKQAVKMGVYDYVRGYDETSLDDKFTKKFKKILNNNVKGFGYYIWKPQIIKQELSKVKYGDIIHYVDSGCHLNIMGRKRLIDYIDIVKKSTSGILVFQPKDHPNEVLAANKAFNWQTYKFTKVDLLDYFDITDNQVVLNNQQIIATTFFLRKTKKNEQLIENWCEVSQILNLIDDSESGKPRLEGFVAHRHDQAIFSILVSRYFPEIISNYEIEYPDLNKNGKLDFNKIKNMPIHAKRDKGRSIFEKVILKIKRYFFLTGEL